MIRRSLLLVLVVLAVAIVAAGCGSATKKSPSAHKTPTTETKTSGSARGASFTVGLNTDTGGLNDRGFNHLAYLGLLQAANRLGVKYKVTQSASPADYIPNLASLARAGDGLVVGVGFTEIQAVEAVAKQFPKTHFAVVDVANADEGGLKNVEGLLFKEQEVGYLAGYAAALAAKDRGANVVSSVGGEKQPPATWKTTTDPAAIWLSATSLHFAWFVKSCEYPFRVLMPGTAAFAPAWYPAM